MFRCTWSQAACSLALLLFGQAVLAGSFSVSPTRVNLTQQHSTGMITVRNQSASETVVQLQANVWSQQDGTDVLERTNELIVVPPLFTLPPGGLQVVRIALRRPSPDAAELSYRLLLREIPPPPPEDFVGLQVALNISLPVFVLPSVIAQAEVRWQLVGTGEGQVQLQASNVGNAHIQLQQLSLTDGNGTVLTSVDLPAYLLADQNRTWQFETQAPAALWTLFANTDAGIVETELVLEGKQ